MHPGEAPSHGDTTYFCTADAANGFLEEVCRPEHNASSTVAPEEEGSAFVPFVGDLDAILCAKHRRSVGNDNTVRYANLVLQIAEQSHRRHYVRVEVEVREHMSGAISLFHGPRRLADYRPDGTLIDKEKTTRSAA